MLGYNQASLPTTTVHSAFRDLLCDFQTNENSSLTLANAILVDNNLHVWPRYKDDVRHLYQAFIKDVDFQGNSRGAVKEINKWVRDKTNGKIENLVGRLDSLTDMVLLNAVYFKGKWMQQFDKKDTKPKMFYNHGLKSQRK